ncbi:hypothetical protein VPNG_08019 [Cytospora leucostoma]|uniref:Uncharacterized protein n=1 Tax=Cytospora leucostoma TaxID=1230097 RepID=A0A423WR37_9PEZI|nr:hypothetical protein VPNG_08019 [Cytospora leucostoma]
MAAMDSPMYLSPGNPPPLFQPCMGDTEELWRDPLIPLLFTVFSSVSEILAGRGGGLAGDSAWSSSRTAAWQHGSSWGGDDSRDGRSQRNSLITPFLTSLYPRQVTAHAATCCKTDSVDAWPRNVLPPQLAPSLPRGPGVPFSSTRMYWPDFETKSSSTGASPDGAPDHMM